MNLVGEYDAVNQQNDGVYRNDCLIDRCGWGWGPVGEGLMDMKVAGSIWTAGEVQANSVEWDTSIISNGKIENWATCQSCSNPRSSAP
jgi:hypothetical protein